MSRIDFIRNAVLHAFRNCSGERRSEPRKSGRMRKLSHRQKIEIPGAPVAVAPVPSAKAHCRGPVTRSTRPGTSVEAQKDPFTHEQVREVAEWLVEAIADNDLPAATYALKACLVLPWPRGFSLSLCQEMLNRLAKADQLDWDSLAAFYHVTCSYPVGRQTQYAIDVGYSGKWLLDRFKHLTGKDPLSYPPDSPDRQLQEQCHAVLDKVGESFAEIRGLLMERRRQKMSAGDVVAQSQPSDSDRERIRTFVTALKRLSEWADDTGIDAVEFLVHELNTQPERIRNGYVKLYEAIGIALKSSYEDDPARQPPAYYTLARDLVSRLKIAPIDPDERLIEAARQVLLPSEARDRTDRTAEINTVLEKLVSLTDGRGEQGQ